MTYIAVAEMAPVLSYTTSLLLHSTRMSLDICSSTPSILSSLDTFADSSSFMTFFRTKKYILKPLFVIFSFGQEAIFEHLHRNVFSLSSKDNRTYIQ